MLVLKSLKTREEFSSESQAADTCIENGCAWNVRLEMYVYMSSFNKAHKEITRNIDIWKPYTSQ